MLSYLILFLFSCIKLFDVDFFQVSCIRNHQKGSMNFGGLLITIFGNFCFCLMKLWTFSFVNFYRTTNSSILDSSFSLKFWNRILMQISFDFVLNQKQWSLNLLLSPYHYTSHIYFCFIFIVRALDPQSGASITVILEVKSNSVFCM